MVAVDVTVRGKRTSRTTQLTVTCEKRKYHYKNKKKSISTYRYLPTARRRTGHTSASTLEIQSGSFEDSTMDDRSAPRHVYELDSFKPQRRPESKLIFDDRSLDVGTTHVVFGTTDTNRVQKCKTFSNNISTSQNDTRTKMTVYALTEETKTAATPSTSGTCYRRLYLFRDVFFEDLAVL